jgi:hypothetical protein
MFQDKKTALWRYECKKLQETSGLRAVELFGSTIKLPVATSMLPYDKAASAGNCEKAGHFKTNETPFSFFTRGRY